jgi:hypothetical protein
MGPVLLEEAGETDQWNPETGWKMEGDSKADAAALKS